MRTAVYYLVAAGWALIVGCSAPSQPAAINQGALAVASVAISPSNITVKAGSSAQLNAIARDSAGNVLSDRVSNWSSADTTVATISGSGLVTGRKEGVTTVRLEIEGKAATAPVAIIRAPVATILVSPSTPTLRVGSTLQFVATPRDADGNALTGRTVVWSSSNTATSTIGSNSGLASAVAEGTTTVKAIAEGVTGQTVLTVTAAAAAPVATVAVSLAKANLNPGQTTQATAVLKDANGNVLTGRSITWTSSNAAVADVDQTGRVSAVASGTVQVNATSEGKSGNASLTVSTVSTTSVDTIFYDGFESGALALWQDGVNPSKHQLKTDGTANSGTHYLQITYPANSDGGWLTRFFMPGYDSVYVRYYVRFPLAWTGDTKLLLLRGSRTDNQWSAFGVAGSCPNGTDFFATNVVTDNGNPGPVRFYSYFPEMSREPDGVTCWGRFTGQGTTNYYDDAHTMSPGMWHRVEFYVKLNSIGATDAVQRMWVDGVLKGEWTGLSFRTSSILRLNSLTLEASAYTQPQARTLDIDDVLVTASKPQP